MERVLFGLALLVVILFVSGCQAKATYDKEVIEEQAKDEYNIQLKRKGNKAVCTEVQLAQDDEHKFIGYATFSDGLQKGMVATIDPATKTITFE